MADASSDDAAVLSDIEDSDDPPPNPPSTSSSSSDPRVTSLLAELESERRLRESAESSKSSLESSLHRLKAFAQDVIKKRDEALSLKDDALRQLSLKDSELSQLSEQNNTLKSQNTSLKSEIETAAQLIVSGIDKISNKATRNFEPLPKSNKYSTGLPAIAYGVVHRTNEIVEELLKQVESVSKERNRLGEQIEHRNYEIAIEVSELEAKISGLRDEVAKKDVEIGKLEDKGKEREARIAELDKGVLEGNGRLRELEAKVEAQRPVIMEQLKNISKAYAQIHEIVMITDGASGDGASEFMWREMDVSENLRTLLEGTKGVYEAAKVAAEKVRERFEERGREVRGLREEVEGLLGEKQHIGTLLRSALSSKTDEVLQVAEDGLREAGIDLRFNGHEEDGGEEDEVYTLAGALENTVKASKLEIIELRHLVEALRAESSLLKAHLDAQGKEIGQQKQQIKELEEKELVANESVEGLMMDITAAEEEIARWKAAAEQEAAAGRAVEQEFLSQLSKLRQELDETKQTMSEMEKKLKFKEETAAAAMAARDAAENSLKLADLRSTRLRERVEELSRQLEDSDNKTGPPSNSNHHRYVCWPWQWLGLNFVRYETDVHDNSNEMELSEPLV